MWAIVCGDAVSRYVAPADISDNCVFNIWCKIFDGLSMCSMSIQPFLGKSTECTGRVGGI